MAVPCTVACTVACTATCTVAHAFVQGGEINEEIEKDNGNGDDGMTLVNVVHGPGDAHAMHSSLNADDMEDNEFPDEGV